MKRKRDRKPWIIQGRHVQNPKAIVTIYFVLRLLVILTMIGQIIQRDYQNVFVCFLTLILFVLPSIIERRLHIDLPDTLEVIVLLFIFAAEILGEVRAFYVLVPHWDTVLHTINGFLFSAVGFCIVDLLNEDRTIGMHLSPVYLALVAFCFSMTIGVLWEFFEWGADCILGLDMQKDTVMQTINSVALHPEGLNEVVSLTGIRDAAVIYANGTQKTLGLGGYLDIGLQDTMKDLLVNMIGATVFSTIGFFYVKSRGKEKIARHFIPRVVDEDAENTQS